MRPKIRTALRLLAKIGLGICTASALIGILYLIGRIGLLIMALISPLPKDMPVGHPVSAFLGLVFMAYLAVIITVVGYGIVKLGTGVFDVITKGNHDLPKD